jgi:alpha-methylacyl-CoA racemase
MSQRRYRTRLPERSVITSRGPLHGLRVIEFEAIGPCPFAGMMLSDLGAEVVTIARPGKTTRNATSFIWRGRQTVELDLKQPDSIAAVLALAASADILIEGFRPGVMERLGLCPDVALSHNPRLVYGRMTGWGQDGPLAQVAGHDITYIAITGALDAFRSSEGKPVAPLNLVGDYAGGALFLVVGVLSALIEARNSGKGQIVDAAMCDGVSLMLTMFRSLMAEGQWRDAPRANFLDGGAPWYNVYECLDGKHLAVGAIEPQFYERLRRLVGLGDPVFDGQNEAGRWPDQHERLNALFKTRTRDEWARLLESEEACVAPVMSMTEATCHPHLVARKTFTTCDGQLQPAPAPRLSRTPASIQGSPARPTISLADILEKWKA